MARKRVFMAMSGGVDSSLSAALLKEAGYEVGGVHLRLSPQQKPAGDVLEQTCRILGIELSVLDLAAEFQRLVIDYFCYEYGVGRTPNPCTVCNRRIKFGLLWERARGMGADFLATGHYVKAAASPDGYRLLKAADSSKDQSYFLYSLGQADLGRLLFPVGGLHKAEVRRMAAKRGLPAVHRPESQDICFIPDGDYRAFLAGRLAAEPGEIVDTAGRVLGVHRGLAFYTVGQRQGLGLSSNRRRYVVRLDASSNRLVVGDEDDLLCRALVASSLTWVSGAPPEDSGGITVRVRYRAAEVPARFVVSNDRAKVRFEEPQRAVAPGQAVVFYRGDEVLGGGVIESAGTDV